MRRGGEERERREERGMRGEAILRHESELPVSFLLSTRVLHVKYY